MKASRTAGAPLRTPEPVAPLDLLRTGATRLGVELDAARLDLFRLYRDAMLDWNQRVNLTAIEDPHEVERLLFLDSLTLLLAFPGAAPPRGVTLGLPFSDAEGGASRGARFPDGPRWEGERVIDVGSGAGIPGLPLKLVVRGLDLTLLEATGKKVRFLEHVVDLLGLQGVAVVQGRAEEAGRAPGHREAYDIVVARGLAPLRILAELCLPFCRVGGTVIAPKGAEAAREARDAQRAVRLLGGEVREVRRVALPELPAGRHLIVLGKVAATPPAYPRRPGVPARRPL